MLANLVLQDAIERIFVGDIYGDIYAGIYVIRGENVVLLGEIVLFLASEILMYRIWIRRMKSYHNVVFQEEKPKKLSIEKSSIENKKNGLGIEFSMAWYSPIPKVQRLMGIRGFL